VAFFLSVFESSMLYKLCKDWLSSYLPLSQYLIKASSDVIETHYDLKREARNDQTRETLLKKFT